MTIFEDAPDQWFRVLEVSNEHVAGMIEESCTLIEHLKTTSVQCSTEIYYYASSASSYTSIQTGDAVETVDQADQVPITGFITDPGTSTSVSSRLSSCFPQAAVVSTTHLSGHSSGDATSVSTTQSRPTHVTDRTGGLSKGAKAGIGVGAAIGGILLIALGAFGAIMLMRRSARKKATSEERREDEGREPKPTDGRIDDLAEASELEHRERAKELATGKEAHELSGRSRAAELAAKTSVRGAGRHELE